MNLTSRECLDSNGIKAVGCVGGKSQHASAISRGRYVDLTDTHPTATPMFPHIRRGVRSPRSPSLSPAVLSI